MTGHAQYLESSRRGASIPGARCILDAGVECIEPSLPFSNIEYVHSNTAGEGARSYPGKHEGIPVLFEEKFWRRVANIMLQLASMRQL
jgi:hypothetical protein